MRSHRLRVTRLEVEKREAAIRAEPLTDIDLGIAAAKYCGADAPEAKRISEILDRAQARKELL